VKSGGAVDLVPIWESRNTAEEIGGHPVWKL